MKNFSWLTLLLLLLAFLTTPEARQNQMDPPKQREKTQEEVIAETAAKTASDVAWHYKQLEMAKIEAQKEVELTRLKHEKELREKEQADQAFADKVRLAMQDEKTDYETAASKVRLVERREQELRERERRQRQTEREFQEGKAAKYFGFAGTGFAIGTVVGIFLGSKH